MFIIFMPIQSKRIVQILSLLDIFLMVLHFVWNERPNEQQAQKNSFQDGHFPWYFPVFKAAIFM